MKPIKYEQAIRRLTRDCSRCERCEYEVRRKMAQWGLPDNEQENAVRYLQREGFLDEKRFCSAFVHDKSKYNRWGAYKIRYELQKKQISETLIREALSKIDPETNRQQLKQLLAAKRKTVRGKSEYEIRQKLIRFAAGKGFAREDIEAAIDP